MKGTSSLVCEAGGGGGRGAVGGGSLKPGTRIESPRSDLSLRLAREERAIHLLRPAAGGRTQRQNQPIPHPPAQRPHPSRFSPKAVIRSDWRRSLGWGVLRPFARDAALLAQGEKGQLPASLLSRDLLKLRRFLSVSLLLNLGRFATLQSSFGTTCQGPGALPDGPHNQLQAPAPHAPVKRSR